MPVIGNTRFFSNGKFRLTKQDLEQANFSTLLDSKQDLSMRDFVYSFADDPKLDAEKMEVKRALSAIDNELKARGAE